MYGLPARGVLAMTLCLTAVMLAGCTQSPDPPVPPEDPNPGPAPEGETGGVLANFTWTSGAYDGDLAIGFTLLPNATAECKFYGAAMGVSPGTPPTMGLFVEGGVDRDTYLMGRGQGSPVADAHARLQVAGAIDERVPEAPFAWADDVERKFTLTAGIQTNVTFAVDGAKFMGESSRPFWAPDELDATSALFHAECAPAVDVVQAFQGNEVVLFDEASFEGGAGAHAGVALEETGVVAAGRIGLDVKAPHGLLVLNVWGDLLLNHVGAGVIRATYPGGSETLVDRPSQLLVEYVVLGNPLGLTPYHVHRSGPGTYAVDATYASVDVMGMLQGAIVGLNPVERLESLVP